MLLNLHYLNWRPPMPMVLAVLGSQAPGPGMALALRVRVFAFPEDLFSVWVMLAANTVCKVQMLLQYKLALAQSKQIDDFLVKEGNWPCTFKR
eukprot:scaffold52044_cov20-Tisochrysis_lutea.AAC.2